MANDGVRPRARRDDALAGIGLRLDDRGEEGVLARRPRDHREVPEHEQPAHHREGDGHLRPLEALRVEQHVLVVPALLALDRRPHAFGDQVGVVAQERR